LVDESKLTAALQHAQIANDRDSEPPPTLHPNSSSSRTGIRRSQARKMASASPVWPNSRYKGASWGFDSTVCTRSYPAEAIPRCAASASIQPRFAQPHYEPPSTEDTPSSRRAIKPSARKLLLVRITTC
jgi:hypothetical protein